MTRMVFYSHKHAKYPNILSHVPRWNFGWMDLRIICAECFFLLHTNKTGIMRGVVGQGWVGDGGG